MIKCKTYIEIDSLRLEENHGLPIASFLSLDASLNAVCLVNDEVVDFSENELFEVVEMSLLGISLNLVRENRNEE